MSEFDQKAVLIAAMTEEELDDFPSFDCGDLDDNHFLLNEAFGEQQRGLSTTTLVYYNATLAGFFSLWCDAIPIKLEDSGEAEVSFTVPAIKIRYGVSNDFKDKDLDTFIINVVKTWAWEIATSKVGLRFLTLDCDASKEDFYASKGFVRNGVGEEGFVNMRLDIMM